MFLCGGQGIRESDRFRGCPLAILQSENATDDPGGERPATCGKEPDAEPHADLIEGDGGWHGVISFFMQAFVL